MGITWKATSKIAPGTMYFGGMGRGSSITTFKTSVEITKTARSTKFWPLTRVGMDHKTTASIKHSETIFSTNAGTPER